MGRRSLLGMVLNKRILLCSVVVDKNIMELYLLFPISWWTRSVARLPKTR